MRFILNELVDLGCEVMEIRLLIAEIITKWDLREKGDAWLVQEIAVLRHALNDFRLKALKGTE